MTKLSKKKIFIAFVICVFIFVGWSVVYKKNDDKLGEELDYIMTQIDNLKAQYDSHCNTDEAKNSQKCKDLEAKWAAKSDEWKEKGFGSVDYMRLGEEFKAFKEICNKCDREHLGQADDANCENLKNEFYSKLKKDICENDKINPKVCFYFANMAVQNLNNRTEKINIFREFGCESGSLNSCYLKALHTENLEEQKQILQENCAKSHQKSCDKLKEIK